MIRKTLAVCIFAVMWIFSIHTANAQTAPAAPNPFLDNVQASIIKTITAQENTVEVTLVDSVLTILRVNSNQNASSHGGRNNEAKSIADVVANALVNDETHASVHDIRVQYVKRNTSHSKVKVIDTVEFRKNPNGTFEMHTS